MRIIFVALSLMMSLIGVYGQDIWTLEKCINYALEKNLDLKQATYTIAEKSITLLENKQKRIPALNGFVQSGTNFGRGIDPITNSFINENISYANYGLSSSVALFQSGALNKTIRQNKLDLNSAEESYQQAVNDLSLQIASYYLNVLLADERLKVAGENLEIANKTVDQYRILIKSGSKPEADLIEQEAQLAKSEQALVLSENALDLAWLQLKQAMHYKEATDFDIKKLNDDQLNQIQNDVYTVESLYNQSLPTQHGIKAAELKLQSAKIGEKITRTAFYPSLDLDGSLGSRFSDAAKEPTAFKDTTVNAGEFIINGSTINVTQKISVPTKYDVIPFKTQADNFLGYSVGLRLNIPIYNQGAIKSRTQLAKINTNIAALNVERQKENLYQQIVQSTANVKAALKEYEASKKTSESLKTSYEKTRKKLEAGTANTFELSLAQSNAQAAENNFLISKYDLLFKSKVLDYYAGKKIEIK